MRLKPFVLFYMFLCICIGAWSENVVTGAGNTGSLTDYNVPATGGNAFPEKSTVRAGFQLYLQSSTNGGKLDMAAAGSDHVLGSVTCDGSFTIVLDDGTEFLYDVDMECNISPMSHANGYPPSPIHGLSGRPFAPGLQAAICI